MAMERSATITGDGGENRVESKEEFIKRNFNYKECQFFIPIENDDGTTFKCGCGEMEFHHFDEETGYFSDVWMPHLIASMGSTNAYGVVDFYTGIQNLRKSAEYVRVSDDDDPQMVIELMLKHWKLAEGDAPLLCISVLGGLDSVVLDSKKRDVFCEGLIKIVSATNAWITTFGLNCGVVSVVSDAISRAETYYIKDNGESPKIICIGVTPWGNVRSHYNLVKSVYSKPNSRITYGVSNVVNPNEAISLNKNHTHYILVDNGMRNSYQRSNTSKYRDKIDQLIATPQGSGGCGIPVVTLVFGGGFDVIENVAERVSHRMPVIICESTGGAAEIIQQACQHKADKKARDLSATQITEVKELLKQLLESSQDSPNPDWTVERGIELLQIIIENERFLSYFALGVEARVGCLDRAILESLIKCSTMNPVDQCTTALKFGCIDVIKQQVIRDPSIRSALNDGQIDELVTLALLENHCEFLEVMIEQEVVEMSTYLKMGILNTLYNEIDDPSFLQCCFEMYGISTASTASDVDKGALMAGTANAPLSSSNTDDKSSTIMCMLTRRKQKIYRAEWTSLLKVKKLLRRILGNFESEKYDGITSANKKTMFSQPMQELFLWAVLNNRHEMALIFWRNTSESLPLSIIACNIYQKLIDTLPAYDTEGRQALANQKDYFEQSAKTIIELCYEKSQWKSLYLLVRPFTTWGKLQCIPLALNANCQEFVSSNACQHAIQLEWQAGIDANPISLIIAYLIPPLIFTKLIKFTKSRVILPDENDPEVYKRLKESIAKPGADDTLSLGEISNGRKLYEFYNAPRTKFCVNLAFYAIFLIFFSYTLLFGMKSAHISILEIVLMVYLGCFTVETIRSLFNTMVRKESRGSALIRHLRNDQWHGYDLFLILLTVATMCLRIGLDETYLYAKSLYSIILIFYFLRVFQMYAVDKRLGPQSVMIFRMLVELGLFFLILVVFLLPYGVASQAMLYPYVTSFDAEILKNTFYHPYYRLYGELNLEEAEGIDEDCANKPADGIECPVKNPLVPILLAVYMLLAVILLVNLLIAIFSNVFSDIQTKSLQFWKSSKYYLLQRYKEAPILPAPFSLLQVFWEAITCCQSPCQKLFIPQEPKKVEEGKDIEDGGDGGVEMHMMPFSDDSDDEDEKQVDPYKEELENSVFQMQIWAVRQIMRQEMQTEINKISNVYNITEEIRNIIESDSNSSENGKSGSSNLFNFASKDFSEYTSKLYRKMHEMEDRISDEFKKQKHLLTGLADQKSEVSE